MDIEIREFITYLHNEKGRHIIQKYLTRET